MSLRISYCCLSLFAVLTLLPLAAQGEVKPLELKDGDRIAWIGGAFVERDQMYNYLETILTAAHPDKKLTFRNVGWSGDTVEGHARGVFGGPAEGFQRLLKDLKDAQPTLIMAYYGANEAHAGDAGLAKFTADYKKLIEAVTKATGARICLITPHKHEYVDKRFPDPAIFNNKLLAYVGAVKNLADEQSAALLDLSDLIPTSESQPKRPAASDQLTDNGVHFTEYGYWKTAPKIAAKLGVTYPTVDVVIDLADKSSQASHAKLSDVSVAADGIKFTALAERLPQLPSPQKQPRASEPVVMRLTIKGLDKSKSWKVTCDGQPVELSGDAAFEHGALILATAETQQTAALRDTITKKNELWFHRHRPQNETYLFLFRKHEQGNNAVEIPQFDPLIAAEEAKIAELKVPKPRVFEIK